MRILKEWYGKTGLIARLYRIPDGVFLDYASCTETSQIYITQFGDVTAQMPDVPKKYINEITRMAKRGIF